MRNVLTEIFKFIASLIAISLAILTIVATITVLLLTSIDHTMLNSGTSLEVPETAIIIKPPSPSIPTGLRALFGEDWQTALQKINMALPYAPLFPLALLLLLALFTVRSLRGWMRWWGIPLFLAGLLTLMLGIVLFFMFDQLWMKYVLNSLPSVLASGFGDITQDVARSLTKDLAKRLMFESGILTLLTVGILYASSFVQPPPDPSLPPLAQPGTPGGPVIHPLQKKKRKGW